MPSRIQDIAKEAQVSIATVSRVLNGTQSVSAELTSKVKEAVAKLGYEPNSVAKSLRTSRSMVIGVIVPNISNPYFTEMVQAAQAVANEAGYIVTIYNSHEDIALEQHNLRLLYNRQVDGFILTVVDYHKTQLTTLLQNNIPVVLVDRRLEGTAADSVTVDNQRGAYMAVEHLIQRGYQRIAILGGPSTASTAVDRQVGYRQALQANGLPVDETLILSGDYTQEDGEKLGKQLLNLPDPPTAVLVASNQLTLGFFRIVREYGLRIPHNIAIIGFDDSVWSSLVTPPITVVDQPTHDLGKIGAELLLKRISGVEKGEPKHVVLRSRLIIRSST